jgi:hypothetical protein
MNILLYKPNIIEVQDNLMARGQLFLLITQYMGYNVTFQKKKKKYTGDYVSETTCHDWWYNKSVLLVSVSSTTKNACQCLRI